MDSTGAAPITRKDLQEELQQFAKGWLAAALRDTLVDQHEMIARKVCEQLKMEMPQGNLSGGAPSGADDTGPRRVESKGPLALTAIPRWSTDEGVDGTNIWQPSRKYESHVNKRFRASITNRPDVVREETLDGSYSGVPLVAEGQDHHHHHHHHHHAHHIPAMQAYLRLMVESSLFEQCSGFLVVLNAISLGYDTNHMALHPLGAQSEITYITEPVFCIVFAVELLLRFGAFGCNFFSMEGWRWNILDLLLVTVQVFEQLLIVFSLTKPPNRHMNFSVLRVMRVLRIVRIARLLRAFHLFDDLRVIVSSILSSVSSLGWSIMLLIILIYVFSLVFLQSIVAAGRTEHHEQIHYWFSGLFRTFLTMFECVVGGVSWDEVIAPINQDISPMLGVVFCIYIAACLFAMMNLLTGVFVDKAMMSVREDKDLVLAKRIRDLFLTREWDEDVAVDEEITWEVFSQKLETPAMKDYFMQINVEISEAQILFELMDADGSGSLSSEEIVKACLRLRGPARSLELSMLMKDVSEAREQITCLEKDFRQFLSYYKSSLGSRAAVDEMH